MIIHVLYLYLMDNVLQYCNHVRHRYSSISLREVALPPEVVTIKPPVIDIKALQDSSKMLNYT